MKGYCSGNSKAHFAIAKVRKMVTVFEALYGGLWEMYLAEIQDQGIKGCLSMLKDYLVTMLEVDEEKEK
jgi:hypothetical protein